jgi:hypothetical protein
LHGPRKLIAHARLPHDLYVQRVAAIRDRIAAQVHRIQARTHTSHGHQILTIPADVRDVVIHRVYVALDRPLQGVARDRGRNSQAVAKAGLDLAALFVVIPGH